MEVVITEINKPVTSGGETPMRLICKTNKGLSILFWGSIGLNKNVNNINAVLEHKQNLPLRVEIGNREDCKTTPYQQNKYGTDINISENHLIKIIS